MSSVQKIEQLNIEIGQLQSNLNDILEICQQRLDKAHDTPKKMFESFDSHWERTQKLVDKAVEANRRDERDISRLKQQIENLKSQIQAINDSTHAESATSNSNRKDF